MTGIRDYIRDGVLGTRLRRRGILAVYDPHQRYRDLCLALAGEDAVVVDASDSSIESRETATQALLALGRAEPGPKALLVYVPARAPLTDEERQVDPFAVYTVCGAVFPEGDGDEYLSLCLKAKPDHATEIRGLFEQDPSPSFDLIDNVGGGLKWPTLRHLVHAESARDILFALLVPSSNQREALKSNETWVNEARALLTASLELKLITRGKTWESIAEELWRFLLFSEFVFDLPGELPSALANVPCAADAARPLVEDLCDRLRSDTRTRSSYIERAERIEKDLELPTHCQNIAELGLRDTFPFEERTFLTTAVRALGEDRLDDIRIIVEHHRDSVWTGKGESQAQWGLVESALRLVETCDDAERQLADHARSLDTLIDHYAGSLCEVDRRQREFEQAAADILSHDDAMTEAMNHCRRSYAKLAGKLQGLFTKHLESAGWPPQGRLANVDVFDRLVEPMLKESGHRVAYILVDALRFELGVALHRQLAETEQAEIQAACAQLPTVTPVGMASLLPCAGVGLRVVKDGDGIGVSLNGSKLATVAQRMEAIRSRFGDRFAETTLEAFIRAKNKPADGVELLVLRSADIDSHLESNPATTLSLIHQSLKAIRVAIYKLKVNGFADVIVATDHGFVLNAHAEAGDVCAKPSGTWTVVHDRALLGEGGGDAHNFILSADKAGIRGDFARLAGPKSMAPYRRGLLYFHGGASLQEAVVPVLTVRLRQPEQPETATAKVTLSYKNGVKRNTTRLPVVDLSVETTDMFSLGADFEILLEAHDHKGGIIGEAKPGGPVDIATGTLTLKPGDKVQVTIRMNIEFEGKFTLKAFNPVTMALYASLDLETDYAV